jgi:hypothetical protein
MDGKEKIGRIADIFMYALLALPLLALVSGDAITIIGSIVAAGWSLIAIVSKPKKEGT